MQRNSQPNPRDQKPQGNFWQSAFQHVTEQVQSIFDPLEGDSDRQEKHQVYLSIAKFLERKLKYPLPNCIGVIHLLCNESDPQLLAKGVSDEITHKLASHVETLILSIKVHYQPLPTDRSYSRIIEIFFVNNGQPKAAQIEEQVSWDYLPPDIRESHLRHGADNTTFVLYPQEK